MSNHLFQPASAIDRAAALGNKEDPAGARPLNTDEEVALGLPVQQKIVELIDDEQVWAESLEDSEGMLTLDPRTLESLDTESRSDATVKRVRYTVTGQTLALKEIRSNKVGHLNLIRRDIEALYSDHVPNQHINLIGFYGAYLERGSLYLAMEWMDGSLAELKSPFPESVLAKITKQVLTGLAYLHEQRRLIHGNLKTSSLLYNAEGHIKMTDIGLSSCGNYGMFFDRALAYMAPEQLRGDTFGFEGDIWSLGISIVELALGAHPFESIVRAAASEREEAKFWYLLTHLTSLPSGCGVELDPKPFSDALKSFLALACEKDRSKRPRAKALLDHPWVVSNTSQNEEENAREIARWIQCAGRHASA